MAMAKDGRFGRSLRDALREVLPRLRPLRHVPEIFRTLWSTGRLLVIASLALRFTQALLPVVTLWISKLLIDAVLRLQATENPSWNRIGVLFCAEFALVYDRRCNLPHFEPHRHSSLGFVFAKSQCAIARTRSRTRS